MTADLRREVHAEVMAAIEAKVGTVLAPAAVVDAAVDAAVRLAALAEAGNDELGHVREGDPDPTPDAFEHDVAPCAARRSAVMGPFCTRPEGHPGQHLAGGGYAVGKVHAVWPAS